MAFVVAALCLSGAAKADLVSDVQQRCEQAVDWLLTNQQSDGGWLYEGYGDKSSAMDTGVVLLGLCEAYDRLPQDQQCKVREAVDRGVEYILKCWDGDRKMFWDYPNGGGKEEYMPMYTVHALMGLIAVEKKFPDIAEKRGVGKYIDEALKKLLSMQNDDGSWSNFGPGSWSNPGRCTGLVVWLAEWSGRYGPSDERIARGLKYIENHLEKSPLGGLISSNGPKIDFTAWDMLAFYFSGDEYYRGFVPKLQEGVLGFQHKDDEFAGAFAAHTSVYDSEYGPEGTAAPCPHKTARVLFALMLTGADPNDDRVKKAVEFLLNTRSQSEGAWFWPTMNDPSKPQDNPMKAYCTGWCLAALGAWLQKVPAKKHGIPVSPLVMLALALIPARRAWRVNTP
ncbi:hypothetical protein [Methanopyrus kandleri]